MPLPLNSIGWRIRIWSPLDRLGRCAPPVHRARRRPPERHTLDVIARIIDWRCHQGSGVAVALSQPRPRGSSPSRGPSSALSGGEPVRVRRQSSVTEQTGLRVRGHSGQVAGRQRVTPSVIALSSTSWPWTLKDSTRRCSGSSCSFFIFALLARWRRSRRRWLRRLPPRSGPRGAIRPASMHVPRPHRSGRSGTLANRGLAGCRVRPASHRARDPEDGEGAPAGGRIIAETAEPDTNVRSTLLTTLRGSGIFTVPPRFNEVRPPRALFP